MKTLISGDFGILHDGHIDYITKAYFISDWLIIATHSDESIMARKGYQPIPLWARITMLKALISLLGGHGEVVLARDSDGSSVETLRHYQPDCYAKGGDRTADTIPETELALCRELGIKVIYELGGKVNQSRELSNLTKML